MLNYITFKGVKPFNRYLKHTTFNLNFCFEFNINLGKFQRLGKTNTMAGKFVIKQIMVIMMEVVILMLVEVKANGFATTSIHPLHENLIMRALFLG